jgi:hypothetical protein
MQADLLIVGPNVGLGGCLGATGGSAAFVLLIVHVEADGAFVESQIPHHGARSPFGHNHSGMACREVRAY